MDVVQTILIILTMAQLFLDWSCMFGMMGHGIKFFLAKYQITQTIQLHYSWHLACYDFWLFPKLKSLLKGKRFQTIDEIQENMMGQLMAIGRTVWGPKVPTLKGTEASLSYVQCFWYCILSSINVSIFHITWLDTFWKDFNYCYFCPLSL